MGNIDVDAQEVYDNMYIKEVYDNMYTNSKLEFRGKTLVNVFLTESIRTRCVFEMAANQLGMNVINIFERRNGEPLRDFGYMVSQLADVCVCRLVDDNDFEEFTKDITNIPVIDGGAGSKSHPTQALVDMCTMLNSGVHEGSRVGLFGPHYNRCMTSFKKLASKIYDLYRYEFGKEYDAIYCVSTGNQQTLPEGVRCKIFHPFPRGIVIPHSYDFGPCDYYHKQMKLSVLVRRRILCAVL